jgi:hypothetical protein
VFLKNAPLLGGALLPVAVGGADWPFAGGLRFRPSADDGDR